jgi:hypothetical protein
MHQQTILGVSRLCHAQFPSALSSIASTSKRETEMTVAQAIIGFSPKGSVESEIEDFHAITRLLVSARESATKLAADQTVYCLNLALEQIARELRHRADNSTYFSEPKDENFGATSVSLMGVSF